MFHDYDSFFTAYEALNGKYLVHVSTGNTVCSSLAGTRWPLSIAVDTSSHLSKDKFDHRRDLRQKEVDDKRDQEIQKQEEHKAEVARVAARRQAAVEEASRREVEAKRQKVEKEQARNREAERLEEWRRIEEQERIDADRRIELEAEVERIEQQQRELEGQQAREEEAKARLAHDDHLRRKYEESIRTRLDQVRMEQERQEQEAWQTALRQQTELARYQEEQQRLLQELMVQQKAEEQRRGEAQKRMVDEIAALEAKLALDRQIFADREKKTIQLSMQRQEVAMNSVAFQSAVRAKVQNKKQQIQKELSAKQKLIHVFDQINGAPGGALPRPREVITVEDDPSDDVISIEKTVAVKPPSAAASQPSGASAPPSSLGPAVLVTSRSPILPIPEPQPVAVLELGTPAESEEQKLKAEREARERALGALLLSRFQKQRAKPS